MRRVFLTLTLLVCIHAPLLAHHTTNSVREPNGGPVPELRQYLRQWVQTADFWRLVVSGEELAKRIEIHAVKFNAIDAWVCGETKVCVSTQLLRKFSSAEQQAAIAHEIGHLVIPRSYDAPLQLWEVQCDLFAAALLRNDDIVRQMLGTLDKHCRNCSDFQHPTANDRSLLLDHLAPLALAKVETLDQFRQQNFAVQFKDDTPDPIRQIQRLSFAIRFTIREATTAEEAELTSAALEFAGYTLTGQRHQTPPIP